MQIFANVLWGYILGLGILIPPMYDHFFADEPMGWKKKYRKKIMDIMAASLNL